jgi:hypothetical protein
LHRAAGELALPSFISLPVVADTQGHSHSSGKSKVATFSRLGVS